MTGGQIGDCAVHGADHHWRAAHTEPIRIEPGSFDAGQRQLQFGKLSLRGDAVAFVGGIEMGHDAFEFEGRLGTKSREVVWSVYELPKNATSKESDRIASAIVSRLKKDMGLKKK